MEVETLEAYIYFHDRSRIVVIVAFDVAKEALWLQRLRSTFRQADLNSSPIIFNDSKGALVLAKNVFHHNASQFSTITRECRIQSYNGHIHINPIGQTRLGKYFK